MDQKYTLQTLSNKVVSELNQKNHSQALQLTTTFNISSAKAKVHIHHLRSIIFMEMNDKKNALIEINLGLQHGSKHLYLNINKAKLLTSTGMLDEALKQYELVLKLKGNEVESLHNISVIQNRLNNPTAAKKHIDNAYNLEPHSQIIIQTRIKIYLNLSLFTDVILLCDAYLKLFNENMSVYNSMGIAYKKLCLWDEAIVVLNKAVKLNNEFVEAKKNLASCYHLNGDFSKAIELYKDIIKQNPLDLDAHHWLNNLLWELNDETFLSSYLMIKETSSNISIDSDFSEKLYRAGKVHEAFEIVKKHLNSTNCTSKLFLLAGDYYREQGKFDESVKLLQQGLNRYSENKLIYKELVKSYIAINQPKEALKLLSNLLITNANNQEYLCLRNTALALAESPLYDYYCNYEEFVLEQKISIPRGYNSLDDFNRDLYQSVKKYHYYKRHPLQQSLMNGSQTSEKLFDYQLPILQILKQELNLVTSDFLRRLPRDKNHPFLKRNTTSFRVTDSWSVLLKKSGFHKNHYHSEGWMSSPYYVKIPPSTDCAIKKEGWLKLGEPGFNMYKKIPPRKIIKPESGKLIQFPSYMWHGTTMLKADDERVTVAYDIIPT